MDRHVGSSTEAGEVHRRPSNNEVLQEKMPSRSEQKNIDFSKEKKAALRARYVYGIIFLITNLKAWFFRDYGQKVLSNFESEH